MANEKNLIPNSERSPSELRQMSSNGGKASGVARRRKKTLKQAAELFLSLPVSDQKARKQISAAGVDPDDIDNQMEIIVGLARQAARGDSKAAKVLMEMLGEKPGDDNTEDKVRIVFDV